jgi:uroporphyrinogen decarboxylase
MTDKQSFLNVMDNKEVEGIPSLFWFHFSPQSAVISGPGNSELFRTTLEGHKKYLKEVPYGAIKVMTEGYFLPSSLRDLSDYSGDSLRKIKPMGSHDPWIEEQVELCRRVVEAAEGKAAVFFTVFSPLYYLIFRSVCGTLQNRGLNAVFGHLGKVEFIQNKIFKNIRLKKFMKLGRSGIFDADPSAFIHAHNALTQDLKVLTERLLREGGADGLFFSVQSVDGISEENYKNHIAPGEKEILDFAAGINDYNILHICGQNFKSCVETYQSYNAKMYNWPSFGYGPSLKDGKAFFGGKAVIGGFSESKNGILYNGTRNEIEAFTEKLIADTGRKGLIIGADCAIPGDTNREHLKWVRDKAATL